MKKLILISLILGLLTQSYSQSCLPEGITFVSQIEIDSFQVNFPGCTKIEGDVTINDTTSQGIKNLNGLNVLSSIGGDLYIGYGYGINSLSGLENLTNVDGKFSLMFNHHLTSISGLSGLNFIGENLRIMGNHELKNLTGLENLSYVGGRLSIDDCSVIDLSGLNNLDSVGGTCWIIDNDSLTSLSGIESLIKVGGYLRVSGNDKLKSLSGLESLTTIDGDLWVHNSDSVSNLNGLHSLTKIGGDLFISRNPILSSFDGLENLKEINGYIMISYNDSLTNLFGLENVDSKTFDSIYIFQNPLLATCEVKSICEFLIRDDVYSEIYDNATGCNTEEEVEKACFLFVNEAVFLSQLSIHPNPFTTSTTIEYELKQPSTVQLSVFNQLGQLVHQQSENQSQGSQQLQWDAQSQTEGMYYFTLKAGDQISTGKLMLVR